MDAREIITGKAVLIVDDEADVLYTLVDLLQVCKVETASSYEEGKRLLESNYYDVAILDIMGVRGLDLLKIATQREIPALMLTAHGLSEEYLKKSAENGAHYYAPKEEMEKIDIFLADVIEAKKKNQNPWVKCFQNLGSFYDKKFGGSNWREKEKEFWEAKLKGLPRI